MKRPSKEALSKAILKHRGILVSVASALKVNRNTVAEWIKLYQLQDVMQEARDSMTDVVESKLYNNIEEGKEVSILFYLKTQGRKRGYSEEQKQEQPQSLDYSKLSDEELRILMELTKKAKKD